MDNNQDFIEAHLNHRTNLRIVAACTGLVLVDNMVNHADTKDRYITCGLGDLTDQELKEAPDRMADLGLRGIRIEPFLRPAQ